MDLVSLSFSLGLEFELFWGFVGTLDGTKLGNPESLPLCTGDGSMSVLPSESEVNVILFVRIWGFIVLEFKGLGTVDSLGFMEGFNIVFFTVDAGTLAAV